MGRKDFQTVLKKIRKALVRDGIFDLKVKSNFLSDFVPARACSFASIRSRS